ncbi:LapD/MoxY N-terminal periplasmic domain-containing protein [Niveibacterium umoris]|uniref:Diguanylate cyclase (GGDEF)-like protein n=1 Tax=Niveibacterium umoris TaxID=1193620 RepID=A0A840BT36_9RHOO|nr:EAL domain-containing protein [Niveibacterium umoris]MBB4014569.1 diguanylate cyclase (GGDEF)-like protein [Niveibacterium umoris]
MSLLRQLWITVIVASVLAWLGSFSVSTITARNYLEQQLFAQSADGAASLALSMTQHAKDPAMRELMVTALFDSGHFELVRFSDVTGKTLFERQHAQVETAAPGWFVHLLPIAVKPGEALVSDGWTQAGRVTVVAHKRFAYDALWRGTLQLLAVMAVLAVLLGWGVTRMMRWIQRPIGEMVQQATAIGERRFITMPEPRVLELRSAVRALNLMVEQVKAMFAEQASRIEDLRSDANRDTMTALPNRGFFTGRLRSELDGDDSAASGAIALIRLADLAEVNRRLGRERTDALIRATADVLRELAVRQDDHLLARLNGADFAWLMPGGDAKLASELASAAARGLDALHRHGHADQSPVGHIGVALYKRGDELGTVLARADAALMSAESGGRSEPVVNTDEAPLAARTHEEWRHLLGSALHARGFALATFPVVHVDGRPWHDEAMIRMRAPDDGPPWTAGQFMPAADRLGITCDLDLLAVELALQRLLTHSGAIAVNLSPISLQDLRFREGLQQLLAAAPAAARRLWVEVAEGGLDHGLSGLAAISPILSQFGVKLGIEHFGRHFSAIPRLYAQRVDYLKIDGSFVAGIEENAGNQRLVKAIADVARGLDIQVIAERVHSEAEWHMLAELGVAGVTGPAVSKRGQA